MVKYEPQAEYMTAIMNRNWLIDQRTPAKAITVRVPLNSIRTKESVLTVKLRTSSETAGAIWIDGESVRLTPAELR